MEPSKSKSTEPPALDTRAVLARIRCLQECIKCFQNSTNLPEPLCYVAGELAYKLHPNLAAKSPPRTTATSEGGDGGSGRSGGDARPWASLTVYAAPSTDCTLEQKCKVDCRKDTRILASGEELCNKHGSWIKLSHETLKSLKAFQGKDDVTTGWMLIHESGANYQQDSPTVIRILEEEMSELKQRVFGRVDPIIATWLPVIEENYMLKLGPRRKICPPDMTAVQALQTPPPNWALECDEELARFLFHKNAEQIDHALGSVKQYVNSIQVSSSMDANQDARRLTDDDDETGWMSNGEYSQHWIRINMKKGTIITNLWITVDVEDASLMPAHVTVRGGPLSNMRELNEVTLDPTYTGDVCVLPAMRYHCPVIEIRITRCKENGIDCRVHAVKMTALLEDLGLSTSIFTEAELVRYPRLENVTIDKLYRRALVLHRFIQLLDSVVHYVVPAWPYTLGSFASLEAVRQMLPLSSKRNALITHFLRVSESSPPEDILKLYINRRSASEHRSDPSLDPSCKNAVFTQIYEGLKPKSDEEKVMDYRWPDTYEQWWECKFLAEGIIDQGGGFRDSLADISEELCPVGGEQPVPLPFFIRTLNQKLDSSNVYRDMYVPNPSCKQFAKYEWIGRLMGACLRSKEHLVLALPSFIWKLLASERVTWSRDFKTVDEAAVKLLESLHKMDRASFEASFAGELTMATVLSDQSEVPLVSDGGGTNVTFDGRLEYCRLVQAIRMVESKQQVKAIRSGLLSVVPQAVLDLLTWQELERRVCGDPEISVDELRKTSFLEDFEMTDIRLTYLWEALANFTHEDRSRFLRFVTGRRRLPTPLYICSGRGDSNDDDSLPESSTCSNMLFLPKYSSTKITEEKLRYAVYNCVAIDTDMSPWEE